MSRFRFTPVTARPVTAECFLSADDIEDTWFVVVTGAGWIDDHQEVAEAFCEWKAHLDGHTPLSRVVKVSIGWVVREVVVITESQPRWVARTCREVA